MSRIVDMVTPKLKYSDFEIHPTWISLFEKLPNHLKPLTIFNDILKENKYLIPNYPDVFKVFQTDFTKIKHIVLGKDPYPELGAATGRAFEVSNYYCWKNPTNRSSIINILKLYYLIYTNIYNPSISIKEIRDDRDFIDLSIKPPNEFFSYLENENGVLWLNTALTRSSTSDHHAYWKDFTIELVKSICKNKSGLNWFFWGNNSQKYDRYITGKHQVIKSVHPRLKLFIKDNLNITNISFIKELFKIP